MAKRNRYNPPASPVDAERAGDVPHFETPEEMDAFFRCRHGFELGLGSKCLSCLEEAEELSATMKHVVALSGGKDSTAMALRLAEIEPRDYTYICTPTGHELPEMEDHWSRLESILGRPIVRITNHTLDFWIKEFNALPNWRQRWCTRLLKIEPTIAYLQANQPAVMYVGLRADEETREGIYSDEVTSDFPLRRWGWGIRDVWSYLRQHGITIPERTDCGECYGQRLKEWKRYWQKYPHLYARAEGYEAETGFTFRSPGRDSHPASLAGLRAEFESESAQLTLIEDDAPQACRVCSL